MGSFADIARVFVVGVVGIGLATALFAPGRQTVNALKVTFTGANDLLHTSISG